jgi:hypothetical protein
MDMVRKLRGPRNFFVQLAYTSLLDINGDHAMRQLARVLVKCITIPSRRNYKYMFLDSDSFAGKLFHTQAVASLQLYFEEERG